MCTVNLGIFFKYIFSCMSRMVLDARKYDVSEKFNQNSTKRTNCYLRKNLVARKCLLRLDARKLSCAKISTFTVSKAYTPPGFVLAALGTLKNIFFTGKDFI